MNKKLNVETPKYTEFSRKELLKALDVKEMAPVMKSKDGSPVLAEGNAILFLDMSEASKDFWFHYYYLPEFTYSKSINRLRKKEYLPDKALILKRGKDSSYVYMGIADLKILTAKSSYSNRFGYSRRLVIITAAGEFVDGSSAEEEEPLKKYGAIDPKTYEVVTKAHYRSPNVAEYARKKANGICQLCGQRAPFDDLSGQPYLEVHHVKWLSRGGSDTYDNVVALCPNCHSKMHVIDDPEDIKTLESVVGSQNDN